MVRPDGPRDPIAGPDTPQPPYPLKLRGPVIKGFGRGSKELGIPTANIPITGLNIGGHENLDSGIYYGFASLDKSTIAQNTSSTSVPSATSDTSPPTRSSNHAVIDLEPPSSTPSSAAPSRPLTPSHDSTGSHKTPRVYPTVLSIGYNPYYKNTHRSIEIHLLHTFDADFYGATLSLVILGFIRPEYDYVSKDALVEDIREDIRIARRSLERPAYEEWRGDSWLLGEFEGAGANEEPTRRMGGKEGGVGQKDGVGICQME
ncbi:riboflavin kinase-domain-containing protein [Clohesyomyces aquaticus]|uniref:Riboflavin kinase n=1 Tax=Clohesyomyces aquaticus TaxID=1231657 RepID=A0A1Y1ZL76_9PLEO|nr:riboflavin kinase-domain-containing protein [Clohesyomyces aquaticus]